MQPVLRYSAAPVASLWGIMQALWLLWRIMQPLWRIMQPLWRIMQPLWRGRMQVPPVSGTLSRQGDIPMGGDLNPIGQRVKKKICVFSQI